MNGDISGEDLRYRAELTDRDEENATGVTRISGGEPGNLRRQKFDGFPIADLADDPDLGKVARRGEELLNPSSAPLPI